MKIDDNTEKSQKININYSDLMKNMADNEKWLDRLKDIDMFYTPNPYQSPPPFPTHIKNTGSSQQYEHVDNISIYDRIKNLETEISDIKNLIKVVIMLLNEKNEE